jgi:hypothetical protein
LSFNLLKKKNIALKVSRPDGMKYCPSRIDTCFDVALKAHYLPYWIGFGNSAGTIPETRQYMGKGI